MFVVCENMCIFFIFRLLSNVYCSPVIEQIFHTNCNMLNANCSEYTYWVSTIIPRLLIQKENVLFNTSVLLWFCFSWIMLILIMWFFSWLEFFSSVHLLQCWPSSQVNHLYTVLFYRHYLICSLKLVICAGLWLFILWPRALDPKSQTRIQIRLPCGHEDDLCWQLRHCPVSHVVPVREHSKKLWNNRC